MKKILVLLLCFNIVLAPTYALANTSLGGWTITSQIAQGASTLINATKTSLINGTNIIKTSTAKITPTVASVSKVLSRGAAGYALSIAVEQLIGAVDWVLDAENNQIVYNKLVCEDGTQDCASELLYQAKWQTTQTDWHYTKSSACTSTASLMSSVTGNPWRFTGNFYNNNTCIMENVKNPSSPIIAHVSITSKPNDEITQPQQKTLPLDIVSQKVIDNAESSTNNDHKVGAQVATTAAAQDMLANDAATQADVETQLNTNAKTQTSEEAAAESTPKDPAAPDAGTNIKITFPVFCGWAPLVCEAAQSAIKFPTTVTNWWNTATQAISASWLSFKEWLDWTKNDSELPDTQTNQVTELPIPELQENAISWSASCPPDVQVPINLYGQSSTLTFSWSPWCQLLNVIKPAIIASAYIGAAFIVLGLRT